MTMLGEWQTRNVCPSNPHAPASEKEIGLSAEDSLPKSWGSPEELARTRRPAGGFQVRAESGPPAHSGMARPRHCPGSGHCTLRAPSGSARAPERASITKSIGHIEVTQILRPSLADQTLWTQPRSPLASPGRQRFRLVPPRLLPGDPANDRRPGAAVHRDRGTPGRRSLRPR